jgi:hypothetical protein
MKRDMRFWKSKERKEFGVFIQNVTKVVIEAARYTTRKAGMAGPSAEKQRHPDKKRDRKFESHARNKSKKGDGDFGKDKKGRT